MRRLIAYIVLVVSLFGLIVFNVQNTNEGLSFSQEFDSGTEVVYQISGKGNNVEEIDSDDLSHIVEVMGDRLEASGAVNYNIQQSTNDVLDRYEISVVLGSRNEYDVDNILRSVGSSGDFSFYTTDGTYGTDEYPFIENTAEVSYNNSEMQAVIRVEVTEEFANIVENARQDTGNGLLVFWQGKSDDLDFDDLADVNYISDTFNMTGEQLQSKVLAVFDLTEASDEESSTETASAVNPNRIWKTTTGNEEEVPETDYTNFYHDEDEGKYYLEFASYGYVSSGESQTKFNANSARSFQRMINQESLADYEITEVYRRSYPAGYGDNAILLMNVTFIVSVCLIALFLLIRNGLIAISGVIGLAATSLLDLVILNTFGLIVSPLTILAVVATLGLGVNMLCVYYRKLKEEVYLGRAINKASSEGFRKTISTAVDTTVLFFILGGVLTVISRQSIQNFALFFIFSSLISVLLVFVLSKILNYFLLSSRFAETAKEKGKLGLFSINSKYISDDGENLVPENKLQAFNPNKHLKKTLIGYGAGIVLAAAALITFTFVGGTFNFNSFDDFGRIEIRTQVENMFTSDNLPADFENVDLATESQLDNFTIYLESFDGIEVTSSWVITNQENPFKEGDNYLYFYADLSSPIDVDSDCYQALETYVNDIDESSETYLEPWVYCYTVTPGIITNDFANTFVLIASAIGIIFVYFLIRYRYTLTLSSLISTIGGTAIATGLVSLLRLDATAYVGVALLAGLMLSTLFLIPLFNNVNQLKNESKVRIVSSDQRNEIIAIAYKKNITQMVLSYLGFAILSLVLIPLSPLSMFPIYLTLAITLLLNGIFAVFLVCPLASFFETKFKGTKIKERKAKRLQAKREKIARENRNRGAEPEEIIIPGIND